MMDFPNIDTFIDSTKEVYVLPPEVEREINEYMEELEIQRRMEEAQTMIDARNIILI
jgi:hypothetical protein